MSAGINLQVALDEAFFLRNELQIDSLLNFSPWTNPALEADALSAVHLMVPVGCSRDLIRIGGEGDGAYLVPDDLSGVEACFSPGVSTIVDFERQLSDEFGIPSYLCDASVDPGLLELDRSMHFFESKWLGSFDGDNTMSLDGWVMNSNHADSKNLLLQMDIEGSEYNCLLAASDSILARFRIIVVEFHMLSAIQSSRFLNGRFLPVLHKLLRHFDCVHAHANNCLPACEIYGYKVPEVIELTFYRKDLNAGPQKAWRPSPLDVLNVPGHEPLHLGAPWI